VHVRRCAFTVHEERADMALLIHFPCPPAVYKTCQGGGAAEQRALWVYCHTPQMRQLKPGCAGLTPSIPLSSRAREGDFDHWLGRFPPPWLGRGGGQGEGHCAALDFRSLRRLRKSDLRAPARVGAYDHMPLPHPASNKWLTAFAHTLHSRRLAPQSSLAIIRLMSSASGSAWRERHERNARAARARLPVH